MVFVRENISSKKLLNHTLPTDIEALFIEINIRKARFLLMAAYHRSDYYFFDSIGHILDRYANQYDKILLSGDFNAQDTESCLSDFLYQHDLTNLVKEKTCFKRTDNPTCIDLFLTNFSNCFQCTRTITTGLSDFHKMVVTVLKYTIVKSKPKIVTYRCYKTFKKDDFRKELKVAISNASTYDEFYNAYINVLDKHAPIKSKTIRSNGAPYMTTNLRKA